MAQYFFARPPPDPEDLYPSLPTPALSPDPSLTVSSAPTLPSETIATLSSRPSLHRLSNPPENVADPYLTESPTINRLSCPEQTFAIGIDFSSSLEEDSAYLMAERNRLEVATPFQTPYDTRPGTVYLDLEWDLAEDGAGRNGGTVRLLSKLKSAPLPIPISAFTPPSPHLETTPPTIAVTTPVVTDESPEICLEEPPIVVLLEEDLKKEEDLRKRKEAAWEILTTERTYMEGLCLLQSLYHEPLKASADSMLPILSAGQIKSVFSFLPDIIAISSEMLQQLEQRLGQGGCGGGKWSAERDKVGDIFVTLAPWLRQYSMYVKNFNNAMECVAQWIATNHRFVRFLKEQSLKHRQPGLTFQSYLLLPVQRIPRYRALLQRLLKLTSPSHPDHADLQEALDSVETVAKYVNEMIRQHETNCMVLELQRNMAGLPEPLLKPGRRFIKKGILNKISRRTHQQRLFVLFSDILIYASPMLDQAYNFHRRIPLTELSVVSVSDSTAIKHRFELISPEKSFQVYSASAEEKEEWLESIALATRELIEARQTLRSVPDSPHPDPDPEVIANTSAESIMLEDLAAVVGLRVLQNYRAPVWIPDALAKNCHVCQEEFRLYRWKHHCRICGNVVCHSCFSRNFIIPAIGGLPDRVARACDNCFDGLWGEAERQAELAREAEEAARRQRQERAALLVRRATEGARRHRSSSTTNALHRHSTHVVPSQWQMGERPVGPMERIDPPPSSCSPPPARPRASTQPDAAKTCGLCKRTFSLLRWRNVCCRCHRTICADCVSKRQLTVDMLTPAEKRIFRVNAVAADSLTGQLKMCDPCYMGADPGSVEIDESGWRCTVLVEDDVRVMGTFEAVEEE